MYAETVKQKTGTRIEKEQKYPTRYVSLHKPEFEITSLLLGTGVVGLLPTSSNEVGQVRFARPTMHIEEAAHSRASRFNPVQSQKHHESRPTLGWADDEMERGKMNSKN